MSQIIKFPVVLLFCLSCCSLEAREFYSQQQANEILNQHNADQQSRDFANSSSANARIQLLNKWQTTQNIEPLVQEKLLYEATLLLRQEVSVLADSATYQQALSNLLSYESKAYLPLQDGAHELQVVAYEIAASAKATLIHWQIEKTFSESSKLLNNSPSQFLAELSLQQPLENQLGYIKTINHAGPTELTTLRESVVQNQTVLAMRVMQSLAMKTEDHQLYTMLLEQYTHSEQHQALMINMLSQLPTSLSAEQRIEILFKATTKKELRNSAIIALAPFVDIESKVKDFFNAELSDKINGGAAAKALSLSKDSLTIEMLGNNLKHSNSLILRRSLLALYLNKSYQAKLLLREFHQSTFDEQLKQEVSQWLK
jgi:hypothetical protein